MFSIRSVLIGLIVAAVLFILFGTLVLTADVSGAYLPECTYEPEKCDPTTTTTKPAPTTTRPKPTTTQKPAPKPTTTTTMAPRKPVSTTTVPRATTPSRRPAPTTTAVPPVTVVEEETPTTTTAPPETTTTLAPTPAVFTATAAVDCVDGVVIAYENTGELPGTLTITVGETTETMEVAAKSSGEKVFTLTPADAGTEIPVTITDGDTTLVDDTVAIECGVCPPGDNDTLNGGTLAAEMSGDDSPASRPVPWFVLLALGFIGGVFVNGLLRSRSGQAEEPDGEETDI